MYDALSVMSAQSRTTFVVATTCSALSLAVVSLRLWSKAGYHKTRPEPDDYWAILAALAFAAAAGMLNWGRFPSCSLLLRPGPQSLRVRMCRHLFDAVYKMALSSFSRADRAPWSVEHY